MLYIKVCNANTPIMDRNIVYFRNKFGQKLKVNGLYKNISNLVLEPLKLSAEQLVVMQHLRDLIVLQKIFNTIDSFI